jgi:hypothetical protein
MHLCRPGPWAGPGGGMGLEIRRAARRMPVADLRRQQVSAAAVAAAAVAAAAATATCGAIWWRTRELELCPL